MDPNAVLMTGENSFIRLSPDGGKTLATRASHWRVLWCPAGSGHTLFVQSDLTDNKPRVYGDNPPSRAGCRRRSSRCSSRPSPTRTCR